MNIMLTDYCSLKCPYCFASCSVAEKQQISDENYAYVVQFLKNSNHRQLRLLGGEPLLHKNFEKWVIEGTKDDFFKTIDIFTNGLALGRRLSHSIVSNKLSVLVNLNSPEDLGLKKYNATLENVEYLAYEYKVRNLVPKFSLGINIYKPDLDYNFVIDATKRLGLKSIRYSITTPAEANTHATIDFYKQYAEYLINFIYDCKKNGIEARIDCNNPPKCIFSSDQLIDIMLSESNIAQKPTCGLVMDVRPNLDVSRCFVFEDYHKVNLRDYSSIRELEEIFNRKIDSKRFLIPTFEQCTTCRFFIEQKCQGGCMGYKKMF